MDRTGLDRFLPEDCGSFNEWEQKIPKYNTPLMKRLDSLDLREHPEHWTRAALYEIILWELNRFPEIGDDLFDRLRSLADIAPGEHRKGRGEFQELLKCKNIGLTMATAILRFINPDTFQTMNSRNSFLVMGDQPLPSASAVSSVYLEEAADFYFEYLDKLRALTGDGFDFRFADRLLYQADKATGRKIGH